MDKHLSVGLTNVIFVRTTEGTGSKNDPVCSVIEFSLVDGTYIGKIHDSHLLDMRDNALSASFSARIR